MSATVELKTACGKKSTFIDIEDMDENPFGAVCCDDCMTIIAEREKMHYRVDKKTYVGVNPAYRVGMQEHTDTFLGKAEAGRNARHILRLMTRGYFDAWLLHTVNDNDHDITVMHFNGDLIRVRSANAFGMVNVVFIDGYTGESDSIDFPQGFPAEVIAPMISEGFSAFSRIASAL